MIYGVQKSSWSHCSTVEDKLRASLVQQMSAPMYLPGFDCANIKATNSLFLQDTILQANSSNKVRSAPTSKTPTQHPVSARITPSESNLVSPPSQSSIQRPFTLPTTSTSPHPLLTQTTLPPSGQLNAVSLPN